METPKKIYEEDIEAAVEKAVKIFGPQARVLTGDKIMYDSYIYTKEHGTLWYGDLTQPEFMGDGPSKLEDLIGVPVSIAAPIY
jgi:hypothetical protein